MLTTVVSQMQHAVTFEEIFDRVKQKMAAIAPRQNPQFEGPADLSFLGGTNVAQVFDFKIIGVQDENTLTGDFGTISDIFAGTTVAIYENDQKEPVNTGEVTKSNLTNCIIRLDKPMTTGKESLLKTKILEKSEPPVETTVKNLIENADSLYSAVNAAIEIPLTRGVTEAADLYVYHKDKTLKIETKEGAEIFTLKTAGLTKEQAASGVRESVRAYAQCQFLRVYENEGTNFDFSIRLNVPCRQLLALMDEAGITQPDAMKIDIEGAEDLVLGHFLATAPRSRWPKLLFMERNSAKWRHDVLAFALAQGYCELTPGRMNVILELDANAK